MERTGNLAWMAISVQLLCLLAVNVIAQPGFLSIDCGGKTHHTDRNNNITWVTDANYIDVGQAGDTRNATLPSYLQRLRFFPNPLNKSCYQLPLVPNVPYLSRVWFAIGDYSGFQTSFAFSTETQDMLFMDKITINDQNPLYYERIIVSSGSVLYICLIRTSQSDDPIINAIELRTLRDGMYGQVKPGTMLHTAWRVDIGGNSTVRHSGNHYLCMDKGECIQKNHETRNNFKKHKTFLGITISGAVLMALVLIAAGIAVYWKKLRTKQSLNEVDSVIIIPNSVSPFTLEAIIAATDNFSRKIGQGGFGSVFFGKLPDGKGIAVKVLSSFSKQGIHQFINEIGLLSRVHHKNLVSLLGHCDESRELMLIYDYMSGGSLRDGLYGNGVGLSKLNWKTRLKIALDAAQGLEYLHVGCTPKIIHRDVKTANILIDSNLNGKLADFGLSKMTIDEEATHVTTAVKGTVGYMDPEYFRTETLTEKSDVYSFGVVLFEIICGRPPINANLPDEEVNLIQWVTPYVKMDENPEQIAEVIDKRLGGMYDMKSITCIAKVAIRCVEAKPGSRPSATEVVAEIRAAIVHAENANYSSNSEGVNIKSEDLQANPVCSRVDNMEWGDNSSNLPQVGR